MSVAPRALVQQFGSQPSTLGVAQHIGKYMGVMKGQTEHAVGLQSVALVLLTTAEVQDCFNGAHGLLDSDHTACQLPEPDDQCGSASKCFL